MYAFYFKKTENYLVKMFIPIRLLVEDKRQMINVSLLSQMEQSILVDIPAELTFKNWK